MAGVATGSAVSSPQLEFCVARMIEFRLFPFLGGVALLTLLSVATTVAIIDEVACDTGLRRLLVAFPRVTKLAAHLGVLSVEPVLGITIVIENRFLSPSADLVAILTFLA